MTLTVLPQEFSICKTSAIPPTDLMKTPYVFLSVTPEETSLVCPVGTAVDNVLTKDDGWRGFFIDGVLDFSLIGILAGISDVLAKEKIGIFVVSTYNTDYIFVKKAHFPAAIAALKKNGYLFTE